MHQEALAFVGKAIAPINTTGMRVLDIGSFYVNGSPRPLFAAAETYVGIDSRSGPCVDVVSSAKDYETNTPFDVVVSCETLEHAEPSEVIDCAWRALKPGGLLILTAAGPEREPHGVDGAAVGNESYTAIDKRVLGKLLAGWDDVTIEYGASHGKAKGDTYATARKPKSAKAIKAVEAIKDADSDAE